MLFIYIIYFFGGNKIEFVDIIYSNPNASGGLATICFIIGYFFFKENNNKIIIINNFLLLLFLFLSESRGALLSLTLLIILYGFIKLLKIDIRSNSKKLSKVFIILISAIVLFISLLSEKTNYEDNYESTLYWKIENVINEVGSSRYWLWKGGILTLNNNPLFGVGDVNGELYKSLPLEVKKNLSEHREYILKKGNLHNGYFQIMVCNGIVAFFIFLIFLFNSVINILNKGKVDLNLCLLIFLLFLNLFENHLLLSNSFFVLLLWILLNFSNKKNCEDLVS